MVTPGRPGLGPGSSVKRATAKLWWAEMARGVLAEEGLLQGVPWAHPASSLGRAVGWGHSAQMCGSCP